MKQPSVASPVARVGRFLAGGTIGTLSLLLAALWAVFALAIGDRFFSASTLQSMAFQMPRNSNTVFTERLPRWPPPSGGLNLSSDRHRQSLRTALTSPSC